MPYIPEKKRNEIFCEELEYSRRPENAGELNYFITSHLHDYIEVNGLSYTTINTIIGVLECAKLELYRQIAVPYEDTKKKENGAVSRLDKGE